MRIVLLISVVTADVRRAKASAWLFWLEVTWTISERLNFDKAFLAAAAYATMRASLVAYSPDNWLTTR